MIAENEQDFPEVHKRHGQLLIVSENGPATPTPEQDVLHPTKSNGFYVIYV